MLQIIKHKKVSFTFSAVLFLTSILLLFTIGLKPGIDFTGGTLIELNFTQGRPDHSAIQQTVNGLNFGEILVQPIEDTGALLRMRYISEEEHQTLLSEIRSEFSPVAEGVSEKPGQTQHVILEERIETIGPAISTYLRSRAWKAALLVIVAIVVFIAYGFRKVSKPVQSWKYGLAAVVALVHDVTITMGVFTLLGKYLGVEVNIPFVVALLTILGYSVNDTIVVFDRIRENLIHRGSDKFDETVNDGVNQTMVRSINTSFTTLLVLIALFLFGGESIKFFALALIIGIAFGTYSSIFLASPLLVVWKNYNSRK